MTLRRRLVVFTCAMIAAAAFTARAQDGLRAPLPETSLYNLDETWVRQDGVRVPLASLRGQIVVAAMGYTFCKGLCPAIVADMMWIDRHLPPQAVGKVKFAFFCFDAIADTPERLKLFADGHGLNLGHWMLFDADDDIVRELGAALGIAWRPDGAGGFDHTAVISLLDADGQIVSQQRGAEADSHELLAKLTALVSR